MTGHPTNNQGAVSYAIDNSLTSHIPTFARVCQSNVPNMSDYKCSKKNTLHIRTNNIASMPALTNNTVLVSAIDAETLAQVTEWNANHTEQISATPLLLIKPPYSVDSELTKLRVIPWDIYTFWYHANSTDLPFISPVFSDGPQFNLNLMTYKDTYSEYAKVNVFNMLIDLYCRNNNVNENSLDFSFKIDLRQKLTPYSNTYNYSGEYKSTSMQELFMAFSESGLLQWNQSHLNKIDARPNINKGCIVCIEHQYILIQKVAGEDPLKLVFTIPHYVYLPNWVSQTCISYTNNILLNKCPAINGTVENSTQDNTENTVSIENDFTYGVTDPVTP
jgi:hypothetical protein